MPNDEQKVEQVDEVINPDQVEQEVPKEGLTETDLLIDLNDNITQLSNYIQERNEQLDKEAEDLAKKEAIFEAEQKEAAAKEKAAELKQEKADKEIDNNFRETVMKELNAISEMPQYESNEAIVQKLDTLNEQMELSKDSDGIITSYGFIVLPAILLVWLLWKAFKNATDGML